MSLPWSLLWILGLICSSDSGCSPTSYYKSCWIRRFPGLYVDIEESQRRGAHILRVYQEESAVSCSRACCLTPNFSCNLAVFHFNTTQDSVNCFHLQCPTLESCFPHRRGNVILYNVTKGVDPDLLVFGKHFTTNVRVLPHLSSSRLNVSEPLTSDKRQFNYPPNTPLRSISPSTKKPTTPQQTTHAVPTTREAQQNLLLCSTTAQSTTEALVSASSVHKKDSTFNPQQTTTTPQRESKNLDYKDGSDTTTDTPSQVYTTTSNPSSTIDYFGFTSIPINDPSSSSTTQQPLGLQTTIVQTTNSLATTQNARRYFTKTLTSIDQPLTRTTEYTTSLSKSTSDKLEDYQQTTVPTTLFETVTTQTSAYSQSETTSARYETTQATTSQSMPENIISSTSPLIIGSTTQQTTIAPQMSTRYFLSSTQFPPEYEITQDTTSESMPENVESTTSPLKIDSTVSPLQRTTTLQFSTTFFLTSTQITPEYERTQATTSQSLPEIIESATSPLKMDSTMSPQQTTTKPQLSTMYTLTSTQIIPAFETTKWPSWTSTQSPAPSHIKRTTGTDKRTFKISTTSTPTITTDSTTTRLSFTHTRMGNSTTTGGLSSSLTTATSGMVDSQSYPNDTKGYISRNLTTGDAPRPSGDGSLTSVWHLAANTVLVALAICATILFCCCCSVFMALSWRGRRRRKGRYRTNLRGKRGSMRLIKYVIVRETS